MRITIDDKLCVGCGLCEELLPEVFIMQNQKARVKKQIIAKERREEVQSVAEDCPAEAIQVSESDDVES